MNAVRTSRSTTAQVVRSSTGLKERRTVGSKSQIMIVDEQPVIRAGMIKFLLEFDSEIQFVEVNSGNEALKRIQHSAFDLILLNMTLPDLGVSTVLKDMKRKKPELPILVFSMRSAIRSAVECIRSGAVGYVDMKKAPNELLEAVRAVLDKGRYISQSIGDWLAIEISADQPENLHDSLSKRELQVMCMVALGKRIKGISSTLLISPKTVTTYRTRALEKMGMQTNAEFIRYALNHGLIDNPVSNLPP